MLSIGYEADSARALVRWSPDDDRAAWLGMLISALRDYPETRERSSTLLELPWWQFLSFRPRMSQIVRAFGLQQHVDYVIEESASVHMLAATQRVMNFNNPLLLNQSDIDSELRLRRFTRPLTQHQRRNVARLAAFPAAASFSVPGAGKTTEALATFILRRSPGDSLMVICPKNAFSSWDEQLKECMPDVTDSFVRLTGGRENISSALLGSPKFMLITYQQVPYVNDLLVDFLRRNSCFVFLDESHRIKGGADKTIAGAVIGLSHLPTGKLVLSGTPMPQSTEDLVSQFQFLYPEIPVEADTVVDAVQPIYVRTTKDDLGLPELTSRVVVVAMGPAQTRLYNLMKSELARSLEFAGKNRSRSAFRSLGRSVARVMQAVSNPLLLADDIELADEGVYAAVVAEGDGPKLDYVIRRTRQLVAAGEKVLIWTTFVKNVELLAYRLADLGAVYIHGGVDAGDESDLASREGKINSFRHNPETKVMVANPAAASESISLHRVCHYAIYLDRSFNAGQYLQSQDRIHRLGMDENQETVIEIVECLGTIDEVIRSRLDAKIGLMAAVLKDASLNIEPEVIDGNDIEFESDALSADDIQALINL